VNLSNLQGFLYVADTGNLTQAAKLAFISQPAMSKLIQQLESELGVPLFDRVGRGIQLNANGRLFYSYVSKSLTQLQEGIDALKDAHAGTKEPVRLSVEVASSLIPDLLHRIQRQLPDVPVHLNQRILPAPGQQQADFVISTRQFPDTHTAIPLLSEEIFIGGAGNQITAPYMSLEQLQKLPIVGMGRHTPLRETIDQYLAQYNIQLKYQYESDDPATIRELLTNNVGVGFIPAVTWQKVGRKLHLARIIPTPPFRTIYLTEAPGKETPVRRMVANAIVELFVAERQRTLKI
jgi:DNA-binding transcriptional LysR family regulator